MSEKLIIIGAGGDGRNVAEIVQSMPSLWNLIGFLDDDEKKQGTRIDGIPVLGKSPDISKYPDSRVLVFVGNPSNSYIKKRLIDKLRLGEERFATIIHPTVTISRSAEVGAGTVILPGVTIMANAIIGKNCYITSNVNIGHDCRIGDYVFIAPLVGIPGFVNVEEGAYMGISSCVKGGVTIGAWSITAMGSVVIDDVPSYHMVAGNPARVIKKRDPFSL